MMGMSIRLRRSSSSSGKETSEDDQVFLDIPVEFHDIVEPFLNQDLDIDVKVNGTETVIVLTPRDSATKIQK
jgi:hypothetical protein